MKNIRIDRGLKIPLIIPGLIVFLVGLIAGFAFSFLVGIPLMAAGVLLAASKEEMIIDPQNKRYRLETNLHVLRVGEWQSLGKVQSVLLELEVDKYVGRGAYSARSRRDVSRFFVFLVAAGGNRFEVIEYQNYDAAKKTAQLIADSLRLPLDNPAGEQVAAAQKRRREKDPRSR
ncbi:MAG: hypothetical protein FD123_165 [Bacteroidetes bacterium]|nr:MAG: hypothetical protein FD123_165 [Bacteroidota bacterium]